MQKYDFPILAIYAVPHERGIADPAKRAEAEARDLAFQGVMAKNFEKGLRSARVIQLAHADHYVFRSNEADVIREMNTFIAVSDHLKSGERLSLQNRPTKVGHPEPTCSTLLLPVEASLILNGSGLSASTTDETLGSKGSYSFHVKTDLWIGRCDLE